MNYDRRRDLPALIGHRALILSPSEIVEALELAVSVAAKSDRASDETRRTALLTALRHEREMRK